MRKNKLYSALLSLVVAFGLWLFVVNNISQEDDRTYYNVPVILEGESILNERNLMITATSTNAVSLHLKGSRSDLNKISSSNSLTVKADLSKINEPGQRIPLNYTPVYPGDVTASAIAVESRKPTSVYIDVDYRRTKELPIQIKWTGTRSQDFLYDTESAVLDNAVVTVVGPAGVVDQLDRAEIEVDLTDRVESISEGYRYTLCNAAGEPVDAELVTTNLEEVRLEVPIRRIKEVRLEASVTYGGGATETNTTVTISPEVIRVSGGEAVLNELGDTLVVATINLAELDKPSNTLTCPITLPEGVTNQSGVTEATVSVGFKGLAIREFTVTDLRPANVPEGLRTEIINMNLVVKLRGPAGLIGMLDEEDLVAEVDFTNAEVGTATYKARIILPEDYDKIGAMNSYTVSARVHDQEE